MNEQLSRSQSLDIISEMINKAKNQFSEDGSMYLLWGWVILFCGISHFVLDVVVKYEQPWLVWSVTWIIAIYMILVLRRKEQHRKVKTYTEELLRYVWLSFVIMMTLSFFMLQKFVPSFWLYQYMFVLLFYGMPTFLSGVILQFKPLIVGGVVCWLLAAVSGFVNFHYHPLLIALAVIIAWIIPGYTLKARFRKQFA
jgi:hypothetical protein